MDGLGTVLPHPRVWGTPHEDHASLPCHCRVCPSQAVQHRMEAANNRIKPVIRTAYGFRNMNRLLRMGMLTCSVIRPRRSGRCAIRTYDRCLFLAFSFYCGDKTSIFYLLLNLLYRIALRKDSVFYQACRWERCSARCSRMETPQKGSCRKPAQGACRVPCFDSEQTVTAETSSSPVFPKQRAVRSQGRTQNTIRTNQEMSIRKSRKRRSLRMAAAMRRLFPVLPSRQCFQSAR